MIDKLLAYLRGEWRPRREFSPDRRAFLTRAALAAPVIALSPAIARGLEELLAPTSTIILPARVPQLTWITYNTGEELTAFMPKLWVPKLITQIYESSPLLAELMRNARRASEGCLERYLEAPK